MSQGGLSLRAQPNPLPSPFVFEPSQQWDGNDGSWSTFIVRVGTPEQTFRVLPATNSWNTLVPVPEGCLTSDPNSCGNLRGVEPFKGAPSRGFQVNASSTWVENGVYRLWIENNLNYSSNGLDGFDTVKLGMQDGLVSLTGQTVTGILTKDFYLGIFGLELMTIHSDSTGPIQSYMGTLVDKNLIPSLSFGYTAGAPYRLKKVLGSLVLGGYDSSRFEANNTTFSFANGGLGNLTVRLQLVRAFDTLQGVVTPLTSGILSLIDSTVPHIWLPTEACTIFEQAFGLTYDAKTDLYLVNDTIHAKLQQLNPTVLFGISSIVSGGGDGVYIELPYLAFDLQASSPIYSTSKNYFPLRRAINNTQFTLGRTFLQEAYITVDYERSNFSVSQALFKDPNPQQIVKIDSVSSNNNSTSIHLDSPTRVLSRGIITGIIVCAIAAFLLICLAVIYFYRKHSSKRLVERPIDSTASKRQADEYRKAELAADDETGKFELAVDEELGKFELAADEETGKFELAASERFELAADDQNVLSKLDSRRRTRKNPGVHISV